MTAQIQDRYRAHECVAADVDDEAADPRVLTLPPGPDQVARLNRADLDRAGVLMVRLAGPPGAGKTSLVAATAKHLAGRCRVDPVVVNPAATRDAGVLRSYCRQVAAIDAAVPDPADVRAAVDGFDLADVDVVLIEACGGIAPFPDIGEDVTVAMFPLSGGDDKAAEYGSLVTRASVVLLGKSDLRRYVRFDPDVFRADVRRLNPATPIIELSVGGDDAGLAAWFQWLLACAEAKRYGCRARAEYEPLPEWFFG